MTKLDFIIYFPLVVFALKGGCLISIKNVKIGSFRKEKATPHHQNQGEKIIVAAA